MTLRPLTTLLRHALAGGVTIVVSLVAWTGTYLALLVWAMVTDSPLGGPLAYPAGLLAILILSALASLTLFFPSTLLAEIICRHKDLPQILGGIPLTCVMAAILVFSFVCISAAVSPPSEDISLTATAALTFVSLLIPLGVYWWTSQFPTLVTRLYHRFRKKLPSSDQ